MCYRAVEGVTREVCAFMGPAGLLGYIVSVGWKSKGMTVGNGKYFIIIIKIKYYCVGSRSYHGHTIAHM